AVVVGKETSYVTNLSKADLAKVFSGEAKTWQEVNPEWPADEIKLFSPGTDSGTFDYFVEIIFEKKKDPILNAPGIQFSEDDNVLVQGVAGTKGAIGYFGYAYFAPNADKLNVISVEDVAPSLESAESGKYPLSRPLFIYTTAKIMQEKPQVAAFVNYYLTVSNDLYGTEEGKIGYFPVNSDALNLNKLAFLALTAAK
ncbi:partial Protein SphX, partial [Anaerolineae bacterium]